MSPLSKMATDLPNVSIYPIRENHTSTSSITLVTYLHPFSLGDTVNVLKFRNKVAEKMTYANRAGQDQTEQSDQGLHCLPFH